MPTANPHNVRIKRRYQHFLQEAEGLAATTINQALLAIFDFETFTGGADFRKFSSDDAIAYKKELVKRAGKRPGQLSSRSTVASKLNRLQRFFRWLACQDGYRSQIKDGDVEFFNLSGRNKRLANAPTPKIAPTLEQVQHVIRAMPSSTDIEKRDRALVACALLTGCRVAALASLKLKHVRADRLGIDQDAEEVDVKFSKSQTTFYFPVGDGIAETFLEYVDHLRTTLLWGAEDPLFPASLQTVGEDCQFCVTGLKRVHWRTADPIRDIFRRAFAAAGIPYFTPHTFRNCLALLGEQLCREPQQMKAWSQNLGHDEVLTTFTSYGSIPLQKQAALLKQLGDSHEGKWAQFRALLNDPEIFAAFTAAAPSKPSGSSDV